MAIIFSLSQKNDSSGRKEILIRYKSGKFAARAKSGIYSAPNWFEFVIGNNSETPYKGKKIITEEMKQAQTFHETQKTKLSEINTLISETLKDTELDRTNSKWLADCINKFYQHGECAPVEEIPKQTFFDLFDDFLRRRNLSEVRKNNFMVLKRALQRYELYTQEISKNKNFALDMETITAETIEDFEKFVRDEHSLYLKHPEIYKKVPAIVDSRIKTPAPRQRGHNSICVLLDKLRVFFNYCIDQELTTHDPFKKYSGNTTEVYGRPIYITLEERNIIADFDLSSHPSLEVQRDIFIFQCLIGCRVSDLLKMTSANIINDCIEYIPTKTKDEQPNPLSIPLNDRAKKLIEKYKDKSADNRLFHFISSQKYNDAIKEVFAVCGITHTVTVLNTITGKEEKKPINEIASSHMARRTFVGNLYKQVKDPNLIGKLSGHAEGSKAFARYRDIDKEMKTELVKMLE